MKVPLPWLTLENLKNLGTIYSVEEFLSYYCYLMRPSEMPHNHKLMFFRKGCKPLWEETPLMTVGVERWRVLDLAQQ